MIKFTDAMNGWGKTGVVIFWALMAINALLIVGGLSAGLPVAQEVGYAIGHAIVAFLAFHSFVKGNQTNGTLFNAMLFGLIGWGIARLINGNPSKNEA